jgi:ribonuclease P protein component
LQTFNKEERLNEKKIIKELFEKGNTFYSSPFKVVWMQCEFDCDIPAKILISVPASNFKKATDRNYIKRIMREAYRKNKYILADASETSSKRKVFLLHYSGKIIIPFKEIESKIILILQRLAKVNEETAE